MAELAPLINQYANGGGVLFSERNPINGSGKLAFEGQNFMTDYNGYMIDHPDIFPTQVLMGFASDMPSAMSSIVPTMLTKETRYMQDRIVFEGDVAPMHVEGTSMRVFSCKMERIQGHTQFTNSQFIINRKAWKSTDEGRREMQLKLHAQKVNLNLYRILLLPASIYRSEDYYFKKRKLTLEQIEPTSVEDWMKYEAVLFNVIAKKPDGYRDVSRYLDTVLAGVGGLQYVLTSFKLKNVVNSLDSYKKRVDLYGPDAVFNRLPQKKDGTIGEDRCITIPAGNRLHTPMNDSIPVWTCVTGSSGRFENLCHGRINPVDFKTAYRNLRWWSAEDDHWHDISLLTALTSTLEFDVDRSKRNATQYLVPSLDRDELMAMAMDIQHSKPHENASAYLTEVIANRGDNEMISYRTKDNYHTKEAHLSNYLRHVKGYGALMNRDPDTRDFGEHVKFAPCISYIELSEEKFPAKHFDFAIDTFLARLTANLTQKQISEFETGYALMEHIRNQPVETYDFSGELGEYGFHDSITLDAVRKANYCGVGSSVAGILFLQTLVAGNASTETETKLFEFIEVLRIVVTMANELTVQHVSTDINMLPEIYGKMKNLKEKQMVIFSCFLFDIAPVPVFCPSNGKLVKCALNFSEAAMEKTKTDNSNPYRGLSIPDIDRFHGTLGATHLVNLHLVDNRLPSLPRQADLVLGNNNKNDNSAKRAKIDNTSTQPPSVKQTTRRPIQTDAADEEGGLESEGVFNFNAGGSVIPTQNDIYRVINRTESYNKLIAYYYDTLRLRLPEIVVQMLAYPFTGQIDPTDGTLTDSEIKWNSLQTSKPLRKIAGRLYYLQTLAPAHLRRFAEKNIDVPFGALALTPFEEYEMELLTGFGGETSGHFLLHSEATACWFDSEKEEYVFKDSLECGVFINNPRNHAYAPNVCGHAYRGGRGHLPFNEGLSRHDPAWAEYHSERFAKGHKMGAKSVLFVGTSLVESLSKNTRTHFDVRGQYKALDYYRRIRPDINDFRPNYANYAKPPMYENVEFLCRALQFDNQYDEQGYPGTLSIYQAQRIRSTNHTVSTTNYGVFDPLLKRYVHRAAHTLWGATDVGSKAIHIGLRVAEPTEFFKANK